ncbi:MAG: T9SS type A sorting domain-containing protein [Bacteroidota bacterium]
MKKLILIIAAVAFSHSITFSQACLPEGITFTTQAQIDNFQTNYPGCTEIEGDVQIGETASSTDITNLNGLSVITSIGNDLIIGVYTWPFYVSNPHLTSLTGLDNLTSVGGNLNISYDTALISLAGLESLTSIGGGLLIEENYNLTNIGGIGNLASIGDNLRISYNSSLTSLGGLENISSLGGLFISGNAMTNLIGIENVTSISGGCYIGGSALNSLSGLENLISIGGSLSISSNGGLTSLTGLDNLTYVDGDFWISQNNSLTSLSGLDNLTTISNFLYISNSNNLTSLTGLESVTSVGGSISIHGNPSLTSLSGLEGLTSIGFYLSIHDNDVLTSISGLEGLTSIGELSIMDNYSLATCEAEWLCNYLSNPAGSINIYGNAEGCNNPPEVADACGITLNCLPYGNYYFHSQADVDDFQSYYPDCTELEGNVWINGIDITNLNGLNLVTSIGNHLWIEGNNSLTNLTGLNNLTSIGGDLIIYNSALTSLTGLENVTSIGGGLYIGHEYAGGNPDLNNFTGLNNLTSIGGDLYIGWNGGLTSLTGLDNVNAGSIANLTIIHNVSLSTCDVQSICDYLAAPNGMVNIYVNAPGCNSPEEVELHCLTQVEEINTGNGITIIPNPSNDKITISASALTGVIQLSIFNVNGQKVLERQLIAIETQIDISALPRGVYVVRVQNDKMTEVMKLVKQ